jgi:hypothetical protein
MKNFGYRFALIAGVTSLLVSALIAPVSLAKPLPKNPQKIAIVPIAVGGGVVAGNTLIKIGSIYLGLCGFKTPAQCGKKQEKR